MEGILSYWYSHDLVILSHQLILLIVILYKLFSTGLWPRAYRLTELQKCRNQPSFWYSHSVRLSCPGRRRFVASRISLPCVDTPNLYCPRFPSLFRIYSTRGLWWISLCPFQAIPKKSTFTLPTNKMTTPVAQAAPSASRVYGKWPIKALKSIPSRPS